MGLIKMTLEENVACRLRAVMDEFDLPNNRALAEVCETTAAVVNNWRMAANLPRVPEMAKLAAKTGLTLDWIYTGQISSMDPRLSLRLSKRLPCDRRKQDEK